MEEDSDDPAFYQAATKHLRLFFWSFPVTFVSKLISGENTVGTTKLELSLSVFALLTALLVLYQGVGVVRRCVAASRALRRSLRRVAAPALPSRKDAWELEQGQSCGVCALRGRRSHMEDRFSVLRDVDSGISLYGVFDGHGGEFAAEFAERHLFCGLLKKLKSALVESKDEGLEAEFVRLLTEQILELDRELLAKVKASKDVAGTTALVAIVYKNKLIVANVGDSRGVICDSKGNTFPLSFDHKPDQLKERRRITDAGGFIAYNGVWRVAGVLATSRALGDFPLKDRNLVIARPDILTFDLATLQPKFMVLASDGLWDALTNEEAVNFLGGLGKSAFKGARDLAEFALKKGSQDNVTVMVVRFDTG